MEMYIVKSNYDCASSLLLLMTSAVYFIYGGDPAMSVV